MRCAMVGICDYCCMFWTSFGLSAGGLQSELAPMEDRSQFRLQVTAPEGTSFDYMDQYIDQLVAIDARFCS